MAEAKNITAILDWTRKNRPDALAHVQRVVDEFDGHPTVQAMFLMLTMGFEAGREFQRANPTTPPGPLV